MIDLELVAELWLVENHEYTVTGTSVEGGQQYVSLRNPWAMTEPKNAQGQPLDGVDDGSFKMKLQDFRKQFPWMTVGQPATVVQPSSIQNLLNSLGYH